jgi:hypothetical protein
MKMQSHAAAGLRRIRKAVTRRLDRRRRGREVVEGLPDGIALETLNELCLQHLGEPIRRVSYVHLSGWKPSGSFRLLVRAKRSKDWSIIYRNAIYHPDHLPSLAGLPFALGQAEYLVYSSAGAALARYLPAVLWCREIAPGRHYQYLLEDLGCEYRKASTPEDMLRAATELGDFHRALEEWSLSAGHNGLPRYDREFSAFVQECARTTLELFIRDNPSEDVAEVLRLWPRIAEVHGRGEFYDSGTYRPIHGDFSAPNILVHREQPDRLKLIDWEWAGYGRPHADVVSLLKRAPPPLEERALTVFAQQRNGRSLEEHRRLYRWCQLQKAMTIAVVTVRHIRYSGPTKVSLPPFVESSARTMLTAYRGLAQGV